MVYDDGSKSPLNSKNSPINTLSNCIFKELSNNIGRSSIRNLLARSATYESLLFIDAGTFPEKKDFIKNYINFQEEDVVNGGMKHKEYPPKKPFKLRWIYTRYRERNALCSSNFLIKKNIFDKHPFDESIKNYGYEDVLFFDALMENNISIIKIDNPVIHDAADDANTFINKTEDSLANLIVLINDCKIISSHHSLYKYYLITKKLKLEKILVFVFEKIKGTLMKNFNSNYPSLLLFDFYRLAFFCKLKKS
ncbi:glycosyl transferase [Yeosuana aromativorans]|uniref:Glycosyl transferase n=1 Tax=Yeosuana aromativorans TaxID=288019 RepID=A0A8J3FGP0_9FLAO|nr:glycosyl transferase [Yeosuana aromativorans]